MRIALATAAELPGLDSDDHPYLAALRARGVDVTLPIWDQPHDVQGVDCCVIRSTWDYSEKHPAFMAWIDKTDAATTLLNPSSMVRWNTDKQRYLSDLADQGVRTIPTLWVAHADAVDVAVEAKGRGWDKVVIKPIIGAGSRDTIAVPAQDPQAQRFLDEQKQQQRMMVQPFLPGIADGEVSLVYVDGAYSHAVVKKPKAGDFRSQPEFGSVVTRHTPTTEERELADHALHIAGGLPLYARADLVPGLDGRPCLIELELVEPCLYLGWSDDAAAALADATIRRAAKRQPR